MCCKTIRMLGHFFASWRVSACEYWRTRSNRRIRIFYTFFWPVYWPYSSLWHCVSKWKLEKSDSSCGKCSYHQLRLKIEFVTLSRRLGRQRWFFWCCNQIHFERNKRLRSPQIIRLFKSKIFRQRKIALIDAHLQAMVIMDCKQRG